jgi:hypothetical protein
MAIVSEGCLRTCLSPDRPCQGARPSPMGLPAIRSQACRATIRPIETSADPIEDEHDAFHYRARGAGKGAAGQLGETNLSRVGILHRHHSSGWVPSSP